LWTIVLLTISNIFMTAAWYGHLKFKDAPMFKVILISWGIAFVEYCFQVPANRMGHARFNAAQLKTIQEIITLVVFSVFSVVYLKERFQWSYAVGFALIVLASFFIFAGRSDAGEAAPAVETRPAAQTVPADRATPEPEPVRTGA